MLASVYVAHERISRGAGDVYVVLQSGSAYYTYERWRVVTGGCIRFRFLQPKTLRCMLMRATLTRITDRRSTTGIDVTLGGAVVSHVGKTRRVVALSAEDAKYIAAGEGVKVTQVVRAVLSVVRSA